MIPILVVHETTERMNVIQQAEGWIFTFLVSLANRENVEISLLC